MKKTQRTDAQKRSIISIVRAAANKAEACKKLGIPATDYYNWSRQLAKAAKPARKAARRSRIPIPEIPPARTDKVPVIDLDGMPPEEKAMIYRMVIEHQAKIIAKLRGA